MVSISIKQSFPIVSFVVASDNTNATEKRWKMDSLFIGLIATTVETD
jgi:hypothetical protein